MRKSDVAYNPPLPSNGELPKKVEEMSLDELNKEILRTCAKCHGDYTICEECRDCQAGRLLVDKLKEAPKDKLSGVRKMYGLSPVKKQEIAKELYRMALLSDDPVQYLIDECGITKERAKIRLSKYRKKYHYVFDRVMVEKKLGSVKSVKLEPKKMVDIAPKKELTVMELLKELKKERDRLMEDREKIEKRISEIDSALSVIESAVG